MDADEIGLALSALGRRQERGETSELLVWLLPGRLAVSHRQLRHHPTYGGSGRNLAPSTAPLVRDWAGDVSAQGIRSIICLLHDKELAFYSALALGAPTLIDFYRANGFEVRHLKWEDPAHSKSSAKTIAATTARIRKDALQAFDALPKPVLIHCSAGIDRSSPVAEYICKERP
jgi:hypothetical protein